ncbi:hypothetical protein [Sphingomonas aliaeris]|uniref:hypothetical protein n=1 Tax=Sphingomonas aliaeris TaxID=2759526 RepID=UPI001CED7DDF|nr:hypothetical protein [Sphingomonas aliaeris]
MQGQTGQSSEWISFAITAVVIVVVMALRLRGMRRMKPLRLETLWIVPVLYLIFASVMFYEFPRRVLRGRCARSLCSPARRSAGNAAR